MDFVSGVGSIVVGIKHVCVCGVMRHAMPINWMGLRGAPRTPFAFSGHRATDLFLLRAGRALGAPLDIDITYVQTT